MKSKLLNDLARETVGDGKRPNLYFVTLGGDCVMITSDREAGYRAWRHLRCAYPNRESALEDRLYGVICSVEPRDDEPNSPLRVYDDYTPACAS